MGQSTCAVILAAGRGKRLGSLTDTVPKCLVHVRDQSLLDRWFDVLKAAGIRHVTVNTHWLAERVRRHIASVQGLKIRESHEPELLGSAGAIRHNRQVADEHDEVLVICADNYSDVDLPALLAFHRSHSDPLTMMLFRAREPSSCGIVTVDNDMRILDFCEKPNAPSSDLANGGVYVMDSCVFREIADMDAFDLGRDVFPRLTGRMRGWLWNGVHRDIGTVRDLEEVNGRRVEDIGHDGI